MLSPGDQPIPGSTGPEVSPKAQVVQGHSADLVHLSINPPTHSLLPRGSSRSLPSSKKRTFDFLFHFPCLANAVVAWTLVKHLGYHVASSGYSSETCTRNPGK